MQEIMPKNTLDFCETLYTSLNVGKMSFGYMPLDKNNGGSKWSENVPF